MTKQTDKARQKRLAEALRQNLQRRKNQSRSLKTSVSEDDTAPNDNKDGPVKRND
ncbi:MAG: hypothetical protein WBD37_12535 [Anderseniella sp.]